MNMSKWFVNLAKCAVGRLPSGALLACAQTPDLVDNAFLWASAVGHIALNRYSTAPPTCTGDWIHINGMRFHGRHGVLPEETRLGQNFLVDIKLQVDATRAGASDALEDTVNYAAVYEDVKEIVEGPPCKLIEAVAQRAVNKVMLRHPEVRQVDFTIRKLAIPGLPSVVDSVGVQIRRFRQRPCSAPQLEPSAGGNVPSV
ncbi:hypothetical protein VaNZ11_012663 [Volvox africanus]|uniref:7,8-dihydroneopterin aldolase n=1 Tax=Volvox africanus TaxID=51714 RepID=A0ABQ5SG31_9CHLO|nr:hypothetical protein VaNZ11_012663 [Volvox africanus]